MHFEIHTGSLSLNCFFGPVGMNSIVFWNIILFITLASYCVLEWCLSNQETSLLSSTTKCFKKKTTHTHTHTHKGKGKQESINHWEKYSLGSTLGSMHLRTLSLHIGMSLWFFWRGSSLHQWKSFMETKSDNLKGSVWQKKKKKRERERERDLSCTINTHIQQGSSWNEQKLFPMKSAFTTQPSSLFCIYFGNP